MTETTVPATESAETEAISRVYEIGYMIVPTVKEDELEKVVSGIRAEIEKVGGSFIAEGAPSSTKLAYNMRTREGGRKSEYDRAYFGWLKFEASTESARELEEALKVNKLILRSVLFETVREDTRAKMKAPTLREVRRTDTIKTVTRRPATAEEKAPVSEEELQKAIEEITTE